MGEKTLNGQKVLVTAGPTYEYIDPISFIGNRSSGKMGFALASAALDAGADVSLICGPVSIPDPKGITSTKVVSALEMESAVLAEFPDTDIVIMAAAVTDFAPAQLVEKKIKKDQHPHRLELIRTPDILAHLGKLKKNQFLAGFAAETNDLQKYAQAKIKEKNLDLILANDVSKADAGFAVDTNIITAIYGETIEQFPKMSKIDAAKKIIELIATIKKS